MLHDHLDVMIHMLPMAAVQPVHPKKGMLYVSGDKLIPAPEETFILPIEERVFKVEKITEDLKDFDELDRVYEEFQKQEEEYVLQWRQEGKKLSVYKQEPFMTWCDHQHHCFSTRLGICLHDEEVRL